MAFEPTGGLVWSDQEAAPYKDTVSAGLKLGVAAGVGAGAFAYATSTRADGSRLIDSVASMAKAAGDLTPFQLGNTFRVPERLSPLTSVKHQGLTQIADTDKWAMEWDRKYLSSDSTLQYIQKATGLDEAGMISHGLSRTAQPENEMATKLVFERTASRARGSLYSVVDGNKKLISDTMMLQQLTEESGDILNKVGGEKKVNRIAHAVMQSLGLFQNDSYKPEEAFLDASAPAKKSTGEVVDEALKRPKFMFAPGPTSNIKDFEGLNRSTALLRAGPAASMERFKRLVGGIATEVLGPEYGNRISKSIISGTGSEMFLRFGKGAALVGLGAGGIAQIDWARRNYGFTGDTLASGTIAGGVVAGASAAGFTGKTAMMAGVASFFGQMVLPGFDQGVLPGLATTYARSNQLRAIGINPVNYYRRAVEGFLPGSTDWKTGAALGIGVTLASYGSVPGSGKRIPQAMMDYFGRNKLGLPDDVDIGPGKSKLDTPKSARDLFWAKMNTLGKESIDPDEFKEIGSHSTKSGRFQLMRKLRASKTFNVEGGLHKLSEAMNHRRAAAEFQHKELAKKNPMNFALVKRLGSIDEKYNNKGGFLYDAMRQSEGLAAQLKYSFFGADITEVDTAKKILAKDFKAPLGRVGLLFGATMLAHGIVGGGILGSMETSQELEDIYSGKQLVEVGQSRWWEGGGTPFEGSKASYFRPHWYATTMNRTRETGIWGEDEDSISPIGKFFRKNFTYELERKQYYDRPYPITNAAFADIPILGGMLAATIGQLIKPAKIMHASEWIRPGGEDGSLQYGSMYKGFRREPSYDLGAIKPGVPKSPYTIGNTASFMNYQFRELEGMTGWAKNVTSDLIMGTASYGMDSPQLADSGMMTSHRVRFWEGSMGGGFFMNEAVRRIMPSYRSEVERHNPIMNSMPTWLPEKFHYGDPYRGKGMEWGEARLPGAGFASLHKELRGVDPEDYPDIYKYAILGDVSPFSKEFKIARERVYRARQAGAYNEKQIAYMDQVEEQVRERYNINDFDNIHDNAIMLPGSGLTRSAFASAQTGLRKAVAPFEYLVPMGFRPVQKLLGDRSPIERYEYERLYGTPLAFWDKPIRDWFRPALYSAANMMGFDGKPLHRQKADQSQEYFDKLQFMKWMNLAEQADGEGRAKEANRYRYQASNTRYGVNPNGNPMGIYWSLPTEERAYFNSFATAGESDRKRILEMIPADQAHLYKTIWSRMDSDDQTLWGGSQSNIDEKYLTQQFYALQQDWNGTVPPEDWIGWHEDVDINDIKVRYIDERGKDLHDYGMWESQLKSAQQQPYLEGSTEYLHDNGGMNRTALSGQLHRMFKTPHGSPNFSVNNGGMETSAQFTYDDTRDQDISRKLERIINGY
jgi:hypothetical protein